MKLANFASIDPAYEKKGLQRNNRLERVVWDEFSSTTDRLSEIAEAIRTVSQTPVLVELSMHPLPDEDEAAEGKILFRLHVARERNEGIVRKKKQRALETHGTLACEVCGFDFVLFYGELGAGFIECHHTRPIAAMLVGDKTRLSDLALVCANCHRMLHYKSRTRSVEELRRTCENHV